MIGNISGKPRPFWLGWTFRVSLVGSTGLRTAERPTDEVNEETEYAGQRWRLNAT